MWDTIEPINKNGGRRRWGERATGNFMGILRVGFWESGPTKREGTAIKLAVLSQGSNDNQRPARRGGRAREKRRANTRSRGEEGWGELNAV